MKYYNQNKCPKCGSILTNYTIYGKHFDFIVSNCLNIKCTYKLVIK